MGNRELMSNNVKASIALWESQSHVKQRLHSQKWIPRKEFRNHQNHFESWMMKGYCSEESKENLLLCLFVQFISLFLLVRVCPTSFLFHLLFLYF